MKIMGPLTRPWAAYWCAAQLAVSRKSVSQDTRISAHIFRSSSPMRGLSRAPMKKSWRTFDDDRSALPESLAPTYTATAIAFAVIMAAIMNEPNCS